MGNESLNECRAQFEQWYISDVFDLHRDPLGSKLCWNQWQAWQAAWSYCQKEIDEMKDTMFAMSDSLGAMAND